MADEFNPIHIGRESRKGLLTSYSYIHRRTATFHNNSELELD